MPEQGLEETKAEDIDAAITKLEARHKQEEQRVHGVVGRGRGQGNWGLGGYECNTQMNH